MTEITRREFLLATGSLAAAIPVASALPAEPEVDGRFVFPRPSPRPWLVQCIVEQRPRDGYREWAMVDTFPMHATEVRVGDVIRGDIADDEQWIVKSIIHKLGDAVRAEGSVLFIMGNLPAGTFPFLVCEPYEPEQHDSQRQIPVIRRWFSMATASRTVQSFCVPDGYELIVRDLGNELKCQDDWEQCVSGLDFVRQFARA